MSEQVFAECFCDSLRVCHIALLRLSELWGWAKGCQEH